MNLSSIPSQGRAIPQASSEQATTQPPVAGPSVSAPTKRDLQMQMKRLTVEEKANPSKRYIMPKDIDEFQESLVDSLGELDPDLINELVSLAKCSTTLSEPVIDGSVTKIFNKKYPDEADEMLCMIQKEVVFDLFKGNPVKSEWDLGS
tara:strand:+ start:106 stop:549 length:444 start_codon:yes stop_codon:yes gene_type:complete